MNFSTDEQRKESLQLLQKIENYLNRLPWVPLTRSLIAEIQDHLAAPTAKLTLQRPRVLVAGGYTAAGAPTVSVRLVDDQLTVEIHKGGRALAASGPLQFTMKEDKESLHVLSESARAVHDAIRARQATKAVKGAQIYFAQGEGETIEDEKTSYPDHLKIQINDAVEAARLAQQLMNACADARNGVLSVPVTLHLTGRAEFSE